jgi:hypothetical protein
MVKGSVRHSVMSAKYAKPYSAEDRAPKSVVFDLLTPPTAAEPDVHPALVSRATATLNIDSLHGRDTRRFISADEQISNLFHPVFREDLFFPLPKIGVASFYTVSRLPLQEQSRLTLKLQSQEIQQGFLDARCSFLKCGIVSKNEKFRLFVLLPFFRSSVCMNKSCIHDLDDLSR